ncbi:Probable protein S-acyltransferase 7 [Linum perenne]
MVDFPNDWGISITIVVVVFTVYRNYKFFFMFTFSTTLLCIYVFAFSWVYIRRIMCSEDITIWKAMIKTPASIVLIIYTFISMWFVRSITAFHLYLISTNQKQRKQENVVVECIQEDQAGKEKWELGNVTRSSCVSS